MKKKRSCLFTALGCIACLMCIVAVCVHIWNVKYYDKEEVLELFQSVNSEIRMDDPITELYSRMGRINEFNFSADVEMRLPIGEESPFGDGQDEYYIWVFIYSSEAEMLEDLNHPYMQKAVVAHDKNIIVCDWEGYAGVLSDVCETLFPETYQKTS